MWKNYLLTSVRALKKEKFYVLINLLSMAMAFALCTIAFFNYMYNSTYNQSFEDYESIYKINAEQQSACSSKALGVSPVALMESVLNEIPGLEIGRYHRSVVSLKSKDVLFQESAGFIDPAFLDIISFNHGPMILRRNEVILTKEAAQRLYGKDDAKGELLSVLFSNGEERSFQVGYVIQKPSENTSFKFSVLLPIDHYLDVEGIDYNDWSSWVSGTFLKTKNENLKVIEDALQRFIPIQNTQNPELQIASYRLDPIVEWAHFEKDLQGRAFGGVLHPASVIGTISSALAILLLACFNFFNTTIATSGKRLKEISMRKVIGGRKLDIVIQFLTESGLQVVAAFLISLLIGKLLIGPYNAMFNFELVEFQPAYLQPYLFFSIGICLLTILLSSTYPAFYISRFGSLDILKNKARLKGNSLLTKSMLVIQFSVCVYNLFALGVFVENAYYQESLDRGYDVRKFINIPLQPQQFDLFKNKVSQTSGFDVMTGTQQLVGFSNQEIGIEHEGVEYAIGKLNVGPTYLSTLGVEFVEGNDFMDHSSNEQTVVVNQMFNTHLGADMMNQWITVFDKKYRVQGVTQNFNLQNVMLTNKIKPTIFFFKPDSLSEYLVVKSEESKIIEDQERLENIWYEMYPDQLYGGFYQEEVFDSENKTNQIMIRINVFIAIVSILISILGLYALISLTIQRRIKEIGIRKTIGASFGHVIGLLLKEVGWMMMISIILGLIMGAYFITMLLNIIYAYHIEIDFLNYLFSIAVILLVAVISIGYKVVVTARMNPVSQLRAE
ncbi:MAG: FtsX-like permease family protein [Reichenbachiella sp.]|uniref:ABC transporter permease n=1 Tax=Reichenbachiella sp. TaxID=2184521 RepID=UPI002966976F|nr:FtsX-like permease family protein [Reichenbachiella sp.]MDW3210965.1 FtsX-like permease family protein [Reichenbachiella sp.]